MGNPFGRSIIIPLTNQSGGAVAAGDVVIADSAHDDSFTTTTSSASTGTVGVAQQAIANGAVGLVLFYGYASLVNVNASVTRLHYGTTYTVAKQATDAGASRTTGTFCVFLKGGSTPDAFLFGADLGGASLTNPMSAQDDMIVGGSSGVPARLAAAGAASKFLQTDGSNHVVWGDSPASPSLLAIAVINTNQTYSVTATSQADIDAANVKVVATVPASGNVLVRIVCGGSTSGDLNAALGVRIATTDVAGPYNVINTNGAHDMLIAADFYITGLTPGSTTFKGAAKTNSGTYSIRSFSTIPIIMEVWSAP